MIDLSRFFGRKAPAPRPGAANATTLEPETHFSEWVPLQSSNLAAARHSLVDHLLEVRFTSGTTYRYYQVPETVFEDLLVASSAGKFFAQQIRKRYQATQVR